MRLLGSRVGMGKNERGREREEEGKTIGSSQLCHPLLPQYCNIISLSNTFLLLLLL